MPFRYDIVKPALLTVLRALLAAPAMNSFYLVGGTALALRLGHRRSLDIDLFTHTPFDAERVREWIVRHTVASELETGENLVRCFIDGIKVDILAHQYPLLDTIEDADGIRVAGLCDIAAMKLNAVANRGARKDFWDIAALLAHYTLDQMLAFYGRKYPSGNRWQVLKSLAYFDDADADDIPIFDLCGQTWECVKQTIRQAAKTTLT